MKIRLFIIAFAMGVFFGVPVMAQDIVSLSDGHLAFTNENLNRYYTVESLPNFSEGEEWTGNYRGLQDIRSDADTVTVPVGVYYRVVGSDTALHTRAFSSATAILTEGYYPATNLSLVDTNLAADNIRAGMTIFGIEGNPNVVDTSSGDAMADDVVEGKKAWADGVEVTGALTARLFSAGSTVVPAGYYGLTNLSNVDPDLNATNIRQNVVVFGLAGEFMNYAVPKTGQTNSYVPDDDGDLQKGLAWPNPRFTVQANTNLVTDNLTGLTWVRAPQLIENNDNYVRWSNTVEFCDTLSYEGHSDWRLPNIREFHSLFAANRFPGFPEDHPFQIPSYPLYWTSTSCEGNPMNYAWYVNAQFFTSQIEWKEGGAYAWPVRGP